MQHFPPPRQPDPFGAVANSLIMGILAVAAFAAGALFTEWFSSYNRKRRTLRSRIGRGFDPVIRFATPSLAEDSPQENV